MRILALAAVTALAAVPTFAPVCATAFAQAAPRVTTPATDLTLDAKGRQLATTLDPAVATLQADVKALRAQLEVQTALNATLKDQLAAHQSAIDALLASNANHSTRLTAVEANHKALAAAYSGHTHLSKYPNVTTEKDDCDSPGALSTAIRCVTQVNSALADVATSGPSPAN